MMNCRLSSHARTHAVSCCGSPEYNHTNRPQPPPPPKSKIKHQLAQPEDLCLLVGAAAIKACWLAEWMEMTGYFNARVGGDNCIKIPATPPHAAPRPKKTKQSGQKKQTKQKAPTWAAEKPQLEDSPAARCTAFYINVYMCIYSAGCSLRHFNNSHFGFCS